MTDQESRERDRETDMSSGSLGGQGAEVNETEQSKPSDALGTTRPGAGTSWTAAAGGTEGPTSDPMAGSQDTEAAEGSWGNRSGSGSGGQGERELDDDSPTGTVSDDLAGSAGTNG